MRFGYVFSLVLGRIGAAQLLRCFELRFWRPFLSAHCSQKNHGVECVYNIPMDGECRSASNSEFA
jgi:hypothetical protein